MKLNRRQLRKLISSILSENIDSQAGRSNYLKYKSKLETCKSELDDCITDLQGETSGYSGAVDDDGNMMRNRSMDRCYNNYDLCKSGDESVFDDVFRDRELRKQVATQTQAEIEKGAIEGEQPLWIYDDRFYDAEVAKRKAMDDPDNPLNANDAIWHYLHTLPKNRPTTPEHYKELEELIDLIPNKRERKAIKRQYGL